MSSSSRENPLHRLTEWHRDGVDFASLDAVALKVAISDGMQAQLEALTGTDWSTHDDDPTKLLETLERSGIVLNAGRAVFFAQLAACSNEDLTDLEGWLATALAEHETSLCRIDGLFDSICRALEHTEKACTGEAATAEAPGGHAEPSSTEQSRALMKWKRRFTLAGAGLAGTARVDLEQLNAQLAEDLAAYNQTLQEVTENSTVHFASVDMLAGLASDDIERFAREASARDLDGYCIPLESPSRQSVMTKLARQDSRKAVHDASTNRGSQNDELGQIATRLLLTRAKIAELLGYQHAADQILDARMARDEKTVRGFLQELVERTNPALATQLAQLPSQESATSLPAAWDWDYLIAQQAENSNGTENNSDGGLEVSDYYELNAVRDHGVFAAATELFGITFVARDDLTGYHPDVEAFEARDHDGSHLGLIYIDWFSRTTKRGGAWAQTLRPQSRLTGSSPVLMMNLNVPPANPGDNVLLSTDQVRTAFHEFGHVLHGLLSDVYYPSVAGLAVTRDFVEFPSQVNEIWAQDPALTCRFAKHHETGEPLPPEYANSGDFGEARDLAEIFAAAALDLEVHSLTSDQAAQVDDLDTFERDVLDKWGFSELGLVPRYKLRYFAHIFAGGYAAGYYCYPWAEVLDAATAEWLHTHGGLSRANGELLRTRILAHGDSIDPEPAMEKLLGRKPSPDAYLRRYHLDTQDSD